MSAAERIFSTPSLPYGDTFYDAIRQLQSMRNPGTSGGAGFRILGDGMGRKPCALFGDGISFLVPLAGSEPAWETLGFQCRYSGSSENITSLNSPTTVADVDEGYDPSRPSSFDAVMTDVLNRAILFYTNGYNYYPRVLRLPELKDVQRKALPVGRPVRYTRAPGQTWTGGVLGDLNQTFEIGHNNSAISAFVSRSETTGQIFGFPAFGKPVVTVNIKIKYLLRSDITRPVSFSGVDIPVQICMLPFLGDKWVNAWADPCLLTAATDGKDNVIAETTIPFPAVNGASVFVDSFATMTARIPIPESRTAILYARIDPFLWESMAFSLLRKGEYPQGLDPFSNSSQIELSFQMVLGTAEMTD